MADRQVVEFGLDYIADSGTLSHMLGKECDFKHESKSGNTVTPLSQARVKARFVANLEGSTLTKRQVVKWKTTVGEGVEIADDGDKPAGVVSPMITTTVPSGSYFWMVYDGPAEIISDGAGVLALGDLVVTAGSGTGKVNKQTAAPADATAAMLQVNSVVGTVMESITNVDGTTGACWIHVGRAAP